MVAVKPDDLSLAFDFVSYAAPTEHDAYVSLDTGKIYSTSDSSDAFDEEMPEDLATSDRYLAIPHRNELDLGRRLALRFVAQALPACYDQVAGFSCGKGLMLVSRICSSGKAFSIAGIRLKPMLPKAR
ncbi:hypothetical protein [Paraburkholderia sacchari]|uniref:hypothetical protein n=1 Tax=Paraburkholderia sacchari TaxID=159450 RepID=UPI001F3D0232|nr:hypothetical protein [Paraburkholderia sacchari]